jgi:hypothetical protein
VEQGVNHRRRPIRLPRPRSGGDLGAVGTDGHLSQDGAAKAHAGEFGGMFLEPSPCGPQPTPALFAAFARLAGWRVVYVAEEREFRPPFDFER